MQKTVCLEDTNNVSGVQYVHQYYGTHITSTGDTGYSSTYYHDHYREVVKAREKAGLTVGGHSVDVAHDLVGKKIIEKETGKIYDVQKVCKQWYRGWYLLALICNNGSHGTRVIENISSIDAAITEGADEYCAQYDIYES